MSLLTVSDSSVVQQGFELRNISFTQQPRQKIAITGETGSGKSTLMKTIAGLIQPTSGSILFNGKAVTGPDYNLIPGHPGIAYLSQRFELRNHYRMEELMEYANKLTEEDAREIFALCRIEHLLKRKTDGLSGGEQQRLALARLLLGAPKLLLLDEPFSNLDPIHKSILKSVVEDIGARLGISCIMTSHDPMDTLPWADEILVMRNGRLVQQGMPQQVYYNPKDEYVAGLFGPYNHIDHDIMAKLAIDSAIAKSHSIQYIRPEQFILTKKDNGDGLITNLSFHGAYTDVVVTVDDRQLIARTMDNTFTKGDRVNISLRQKQLY
ncbi:MAG: ABC transporter ATP-binding protein [Sphingobacteriales bacterium]|nr:MAG: ABC transporter ATP-binding protein [Sphingobacteriales bacterium]